MIVTTYKVTLSARIPALNGRELTQAQQDVVKQKLRDTRIQDYLIDTLGWTHVDRVMDTIVIHYQV